MYIPVQTILDKIGAELQKAKQSDSEADVRQALYTIKSLCELTLNENSQSAPNKQKISAAAAAKPANKVKEEQKRKSVLEEDYFDDDFDDFDDDFSDANGKSIFDF